MTLSGGLIALVALIYMTILFAIAFYGDRKRESSMSPRCARRGAAFSRGMRRCCPETGPRRGGGAAAGSRVEAPVSASMGV
ncbi:hypothetical protein SSTU70S_05455 [Stutzerimonas stutzeri]